VKRDDPRVHFPANSGQKVVEYANNTAATPGLVEIQEDQRCQSCRCAAYQTVTSTTGDEKTAARSNLTHGKVTNVIFRRVRSYRKFASGAHKFGSAENSAPAIRHDARMTA